MTRCVLVVDDNDINRALAKDALELYGYRVLTASNGCEALELAARECPSVMVLDIQMPYMSGLEVLRRLRLASETHVRSIRVIAATALATQADRTRCFDAGADDYIARPFRFRDLAERVSRWSKEPACTA
jgi:CheY-like chemotaxis protein